MSLTLTQPAKLVSLISLLTFASGCVMVSEFLSLDDKCSAFLFGIRQSKVSRSRSFARLSL